MYKNIFIDMDGTVIDSREGVWFGIKHAMKAVGYEEPGMDKLSKCIGPPFSYSFPNILGIRPEDHDAVFREYKKIYNEGVMFQCKMYDGVAEFLKRMSSHGYSISLCSSKNEEACRAILEKYDVAQYFVEIGGADQSKGIDTKIDVINELYRRAPWTRKEDTVLIGDTRFDVEGAMSGGIDCIGIAYGFGTREELDSAGAIAVFDRLDEVADYIEGKMA